MPPPSARVPKPVARLWLASTASLGPLVSCREQGSLLAFLVYGLPRTSFPKSARRRCSERRKAHRETRSAHRACHGEYGSPVLDHDLLYDRQPQPRAVALTGHV